MKLKAGFEDGGTEARVGCRPSLQEFTLCPLATLGLLEPRLLHHVFLPGWCSSGAAKSQGGPALPSGPSQHSTTLPSSTWQRGPSFWQGPVPPLRFQTPSPLSSEIANFCSVSTGCQPLWWVSWVHNNNRPLPLVAATENVFHLNPIQLPSSTVLVLPSPQPHFFKFIYDRHLHSLPAPTLALPGSPS